MSPPDDVGGHVAQQPPDDRRVADGAEDKRIDSVLLGRLEEGLGRFAVD